MKGEARVVVKAAPQDVWAMVSDVTRMGEWSPETFRCEWVGGATGPVVGARFKGANRVGPIRWSTEPVVTASEPGRVFEFDTGDVRWRYELRPADGGTEVVESYELHSARARVVAVLGLRKPQLDLGVRRTLARLKEAAERGAARG